MFPRIETSMFLPEGFEVWGTDRCAFRGTDVRADGTATYKEKSILWPPGPGGSSAKHEDFADWPKFLLDRFFSGRCQAIFASQLRARGSGSQHQGAMPDVFNYYRGIHALPSSARKAAVLRRHRSGTANRRLEFGDLVIDSGKHKVSVAEETIHLTTTEFKLLEYLAQRPGNVLSRDQILDVVSGYDAMVSDRTVDAHIKTFRRKLGIAKHFVETVRGAGYRFKDA